MTMGRLKAFSDGVIAMIAAVMWLAPDCRIEKTLGRNETNED